MTESIHEFAWVAPADHPALAGHFPGNPIFPGVALLDQALFLAEQLNDESVGTNLWRVDSAKFLSPVRPGEALLFTLTQKPNGGLAFTIRCAAREVASGRLTPRR